MPDNYIKPNLKEIFLYDKDKQEKGFKYEQIFDNNRWIVLAEPGFGKSRLLFQSLEEFENKGFQSCKIDLKLLETTGIETFIKQKLAKNATNTLLSGIPSFYSSTNFKLDKDIPTLFCFDALDEVGQDYLTKTVEIISDFIADFPNATFIISCRIHHFEREKDYNSIWQSFQSFQISSFEYFQVAKYLEYYLKDNNQDKIQSILDSLHNKGLISTWRVKGIVSTPRYLKLLVELINSGELGTFEDITRCSLFDKFINQRLKEEATEKSGENYKNRISHIRLALEKMALIMEIQRVNSISKDDFAQVMSDTDIDVSNQILLDVFYDRTILKDKGDDLEFDNTEFQEYLAAKALSRLDAKNQSAFDLAVNSHLQDIYPSWLDVINYLCELDSSVILPFVAFACRNKRPNLFILISNYTPQYFDKNQDEKAAIFEHIFGYYLKNRDYFNNQLDNYLGKYFILDKHDDLLKSEAIIASTNNEDVKIYQSLLLKEILPITENESFRDYWKDKLFEYANEPIKNGDTLQRSAVGALCETFEIDDLLDLVKISTIQDTVYSFFKSKDINHKIIVELLFKKIKPKSDDINLFKEKRAFVNLFDYVLLSDNNLMAFFKYDFNLENQFFENLLKVWDVELEHCLIKILREIILIEDRIQNTESASKIAQFLEENGNNSLFFFWDAIKDSETKKFEDINFLFIDIIGHLLNEDNLDSFWYQAKDKLARKIMFFILRSTKQFGSEKAKEIIRRDFNDFFIEAEKSQKKYNGQSEMQNQKQGKYQFKKYQEFKDFLTKKSYWAIYSFQNDSEIYKSLYTENDTDELKELIFEAFNKFDTAKDGYVNKKLENQIDISNVVVLYHHLVRLVGKLKLDITPYRQKIINYLPFWNDEAKVYEVIGEMSEGEQTELLNLMTSEREDDLVIHGIGSFVTACEQSNIIKAIPFLKERLLDERIEYYIKKQIILFLEKNGVKTTYFKDIFTHYFQDKVMADADYSVAVALNKMLLKHQDKDAVEWRIEQILINKYLLQERFSGGSIIRGVLKEEKLGEDLSLVNSSVFRHNFEDLQRKSFELLKEDSLHYKMVRDEIWKPCEIYFSSLKLSINDTEEMLKTLGGIYEDNSAIPQASNFSYNLNTIRERQMQRIGEPMAINSAIKAYKKLKDMQYLDIATSHDLFKLIQEIIKVDLTKWVLEQGGDDLIKNYNTNKRETSMQQMLKIQFENYLYLRGFRGFNVIREPQMFNGKRPDFLITYGTIGCIVVELKRGYNPNSSHPEDYRKTTFLPYVESFDCSHGILLIMRDDENEPKDFNQLIQMNKSVYESDWNIEVIGIDCVKNIIIKAEEEAKKKERKEAKSAKKNSTI